jgi:hypothetical protein
MNRTCDLCARETLGGRLCAACAKQEHERVILFLGTTGALGLSLPLLAFLGNIRWHWHPLASGLVTVAGLFVAFSCVRAYRGLRRTDVFKDIERK